MSWSRNFSRERDLGMDGMVAGLGGRQTELDLELHLHLHSQWGHGPELGGRMPED